jgi:hypothetical protein
MTDRNKMASGDKRNALLGSEIVTCSQCKGELSEIKQCDSLCKESVGRNNNDLFNLQEDMRELRNLLETAVRRSVKEVILHEINVILGKIDSLTEDCMRKMESDLCWTEVTNRRIKLHAKQNKQFQIPVINNQYALLSNLREPDWNGSISAKQRKI